ncbi:MFS transporter [Streptomyces chrestomyceticus JCM 4735]|uniref:MFS transporter n=1 Tax=Streptomyces chrestomyceticus JCM 4735 TaxID=1306181 RepID=A0A7U9L3A6_9ACTN|nr:MFS transporter [Streptomyces chrestomyceticus]GCD40257.1 MFS transporter [Streptomyces chrestomyceticus JCM 4735]
MSPRLASLSHRRSPSESPAADHTRPAVSVGLVFAICLVAANLRTSLTGVGTLLPAIERGSGLTSSWGGLLSTLPLLTFAATSPLVARASHRFGTARLLVAALGALTVGTVVRSLPSVLCLFTGTVILSAAIAFGNVLLPALIRRSMPAHRIQGISALYVTVMGVTAAVSSGISAPLSHTLPASWHTALAWGVAFTVAAFLAWLPRMRDDRPHSDRPRSDRPHSNQLQSNQPHSSTGVARSPAPWRSRLAWQVSMFMGLQSLAFYTAVAWLPSILMHRGSTSTTAGWMLFYYQLVSLTASSLLPLLTRGRHDQRWTAVGASVAVAGGFAVLASAPALSVLACTLLGLGGGACLVLALTFQSERAGSSGEAAALAGMAQSVGYLVAAAGPLLLGILHDSTGSWTLPLVVLVVLSAAMAGAGYGAGRNRLVRCSAR